MRVCYSQCANDAATPYIFVATVVVGVVRAAHPDCVYMSACASSSESFGRAVIVALLI
jgi:hypothetical protein